MRGAFRRCALSTRFHDDPGYIRALARCVNEYWEKHRRPDHLVLSFHGVPRRSLTLGDPYHCYRQVTGRLLARELGLESKQWTLTFQSRFGRAEWLTPYTFDTLADLARGTHEPRRRVLPGLRVRLPGDAGGDRDRGKAEVPEGGRRRTARDSVPERASGLDGSTHRPCIPAARRLADRAARRGRQGAHAAARQGDGRQSLNQARPARLRVDSSGRCSIST